MMLDVTMLRRAGGLAEGGGVTWGWSNGHRLTLDHRRAESPGLAVELVVGSNTLDLINRVIGVELAPLGLPGGGARAWWRCPACQGRAARLYVSGAELLCRRCAGLVHRSSQAGRVERLDRKLDKLNRRLGAPGFGAGDGRFRPPARPASMTLATYERLALAWKDTADRRFDAIFTPACLRRLGVR